MSARSFPQTATIKQLATVFGVDERTIRRWQHPEADESADAAKTPIPSRKEGRSTVFPIAECVTWYVEHRVRIATRPLTELDLAKLRKATADARLQELELQELEGMLVRIETATKTLAGILDELRSRAIALTGRLSPLVVGVPDVAQATAIIEPVVHELLEVMSRTSVPLIQDVGVAA